MATLSKDGTKILNNYCRFTGVPFNATIVTTWIDGTPMDDSKVDNSIYFKNSTTVVPTGGYSKRDFEGLPNVLWFGADPTGAFDSATQVQKCLNVFGKCYFPGGRYKFNSMLHNYRTMSIVDYYSTSTTSQVNGIVIQGESKTTVTLINNITGTSPLIDLDGNYFGTGTLLAPACQVGNYLDGFTIEGTTTKNGIRLRAIWEADFKNIRMKGLNICFELKGAVTADSATSNMLRFDKVISSNSAYGILGEESRIGTMDVVSCEFRSMSINGIKLTCAGFSIKATNVAGCGNNSDTTSGGLRITSGSTASQNRAFKIDGNIFENNKWSDIYLENADGVSINSNTFHPYFNIPTGVGNEQVCIRIVGNSTYGVAGVSIAGNRIQPGANPVSGAEIFRFLKASGNAKDIKVSALSAPIDSHLQYLYDVSIGVDGFETDSFGVNASWVVPQGSAVPVFTGDNAAVFHYDTLILPYIVRDFDYSGGVDAGATFVGSRFDSQFRYLIPWNGIYNVTVGASFSGLVNGTHTSVRIVLIAGTRRYVIRQVDSGITSVSRGNNSIQVKLYSGDYVYIQLQVTGSSKVVTLSEASNYIPLMLTINQV